jgi:hypothetical protein
MTALAAAWKSVIIAAIAIAIATGGGNVTAVVDTGSHGMVMRAARVGTSTPVRVAKRTPRPRQPCPRRTCNRRARLPERKRLAPSLFAPNGANAHHPASVRNAVNAVNAAVVAGAAGGGAAAGAKVARTDANPLRQRTRNRLEKAVAP